MKLQGLAVDPGVRVELGIVDGHLIGEFLVAEAAELFGDMEGVAMRMSHTIQPGPVACLEASGLNDQRIALPTRGIVAHPPGLVACSRLTHA